MKTSTKEPLSNPDRVHNAKVPQGWRFLTSSEKNSRRKLRIRVWETYPKPQWGPVIAVRVKPTTFTAIRRDGRVTIRTMPNLNARKLAEIKNVAFAWSCGALSAKKAINAVRDVVCGQLANEGANPPSQP